MKSKTPHSTQLKVSTTRLQLCSSATQSITVGGQVFTPDAATAYVEFHLAHAFPVYLDTAEPGGRPDCTAMHPQVIANSYRSMLGKPVNFHHLMKAYDPKNILKDHVWGTVMAVEFPEAPADGWCVQGDPLQAPGIRACAALHKNAEGVRMVIDTWEKGITPFSDTDWTVSMENQSDYSQGGFLIKLCDTRTNVPEELKSFDEATPKDFRALGWVYVPYASAPADLLGCLKTGNEAGLAKDFGGRQTLFLNGGLTGSVFFYGVALTPAGKESKARVSRIMADASSVFDLSAALEAVTDFAAQAVHFNKTVNLKK